MPIPSRVLLVFLLSIVTFLVQKRAQCAVVDGFNDTPPASEFLFGFSDRFAATLDLAFSDSSATTLSTNNGVFGEFSQGWWSDFRGNSDSNTNYIVGDTSNNGTRNHNNFFTFDTSGLSKTVTAATLSLRREDGTSSSGKTSHLYLLFDVSTDATTLNDNSSFNLAIHNDLETGRPYGQHSVTVAGSPSEILNFALNGNAVSDLNTTISGSGRFFSIGGTLDAAATVVPEPSSLVIVLGLGVCGFFRLCCGIAAAYARANLYFPDPVTRSKFSWF